LDPTSTSDESTRSVAPEISFVSFRRSATPSHLVQQPEHRSYRSERGSAPHPGFARPNRRTTYGSFSDQKLAELIALTG
jgi:hypothetical protein